MRTDLSLTSILSHNCGVELIFQLIYRARDPLFERWEGRPCRYPGDVKSGPDITILRAQRRGLVWNDNGRTTTKQQMEKAGHQTIQASLVDSTVPTTDKTLRRPKKTPWTIPRIVFPHQARSKSLLSDMAVPTTQGFRAREKNWISFNKTVFATAVHRDSITQILIQT
ncbi:hypothetical protein BJV77DRAFT_979488 [Russula vinacea]|nr:hypothetical protein BJV77DRAFT_979488 [Russula vinacea]